MRYEFTKSDISIGKKLLCTFGVSNDYTVGKMYTITVIDSSSGVCGIPINNGSLVVWDLSWLNDKGNRFIRFIPYDILTDREKFIYELSGRMPCLDHYLGQ